MMNEKPLARSPDIHGRGIGYNGEIESTMTYIFRFEDTGRIDVIHPEKFRQCCVFHPDREYENRNAVAPDEFPNNGCLCIEAEGIAYLEQHRTMFAWKQ